MGNNKPRVQNKDQRIQNILTLHVLDHLKRGLYAKQIADELGAKPNKVHYHIKKLLRAGLIEQDTYSSMKAYSLTPRGETACKRARVQKFPFPSNDTKEGVHDLYIKLPIMQRPASVDGGLWTKVNDRFRNSKQFHAHFEDIGASIRETTKHICIQLRPRAIENYGQVHGIIAGAIGYVLGELTKRGYVLDYMNPSVMGLHLTFEDRKSHEMVKKGDQVTVKLSRDRHKFFPGDPDQQAFVTVDKTPGPNWESNDLEHHKLRAMEPEYVNDIRNTIRETVEVQRNMAEDMATYAKHLASHTKFIMKAAKVMGKLDNRLSQRRLGEFS